MRGKNREMRVKKKKKIWPLILGIFVVIGLAGGVFIKTLVTDEKTNGMTITNSEAIRLISYLGVGGYDYPDKLGSAFTVKEARKLFEAAGADMAKAEISIEHTPGFVPLTRTQFESLYETLIEELQLDRLFSTNLYIYDIDSSNDKEIDGTVYEIVNTNGGDYYMEKDYGMNRDYIGKVVKLYVSNNEIILCLGESKEDVVIKNTYVSGISDGEDGKELLCYVNGTMQRLPFASKDAVPVEDTENYLADINISNRGVTGVTNHLKELVPAKVTAYQGGCVSVEGYEEPLYLSDSFHVYKTNGTFKAMKSAGTLIGYSQVSLYIVDSIVEAALITEDIYAKNIRVLINNTDYTSLYHNGVNITSDTAFTVSYGDTVEEYEAGERIEYRNGSKEFAGGNIRICSKEEEGRITISSVKRQYGEPSYRGTIELAKDDKGVLVINELSVEQYLYGVVPSEMPVSYEMEALKAQAICARAYAYRQMEGETYAEYGAHLDDSISSQVYNNVEEDERAVFAVDDTYGVVPCYNDSVIEAFFFSTSCGTTSNNSVVWGGNPEAYLLDTMETELNDLANLENEESFRSFINGELGTGFIEEDEPFFRWEVSFTKDKMTKAVNDHLYDRIQVMPEKILAKNANGDYEKKSIKSIGDVVSVEVTKRGSSGIIEEMIITGTAETILVMGQANARALLCPEGIIIRKQDGSTVTGWSSLPSAYFYVEESNGFTLHGGGFGHGVGLSQNGANDMAKLGYTASDIIAHYYTAVELKDMYKMMGK
ncbi:MAG: SpoIID/LytB domain-containing protein [Lachnospiraceae bacterium]|nr:SpoIID/LytB domain-containing protein [Lachnospiraceae bacterium]